MAEDRTGSRIRRYEFKYIIHPSQVEQVRSFLQPFCESDPFAQGQPPEYAVTTLQFDTSDLAFHRAKEYESLNRFKLRVRTYGTPGDHKVVLEIKRKHGRAIEKSRAAIAPELWDEGVLERPVEDLNLSPVENQSFLEFKRLLKETGARPILFVRYIREAWFSRIDQYARITMDRALSYQLTSHWAGWGQNNRWRRMDLPGIFKRDYSGLVLEVKCTHQVPYWMQELTSRMGLISSGFCKYSSALKMESLFGILDIDREAS